MSIKRVNCASKSYTGTITFAQNQNRTAFFVFAKSGAATIEIGSGGGEIDLAQGGWFEMLVTPTSEVVIVTAGTVIVVSDQTGVEA